MLYLIEIKSIVQYIGIHGHLANVCGICSTLMHARSCMQLPIIVNHD